MAASGLFPEPEKIKYENEKARWQHLADLTEFAFALKDTLDSINQQSFNNFLLRIGKYGRVNVAYISKHVTYYWLTQGSLEPPSPLQFMVVDGLSHENVLKFF